MRRLILGSALAAVLTIGVHGTSFASTTAPVTPDVRLDTTGVIVVFDGENLSNQPRNGGDDSDLNGNNGSDN
jgi:hypothetical protein